MKQGESSLPEAPMLPPEVWEAALRFREHPRVLEVFYSGWGIEVLLLKATPDEPDPPLPPEFAEWPVVLTTMPEGPSSRGGSRIW